MDDQQKEAQQLGLFFIEGRPVIRGKLQTVHGSGCCHGRMYPRELFERLMREGEEKQRRCDVESGTDHHQV